MRGAVSYVLSSVTSTVLMCLAVPEFIWDMYQLDTGDVFPWLYLVWLICLGLLLRPHHGKTVWGCTKKGLLVGVVAGILAQLAVLLVEHERFATLNASLIWQTLLSMCLMSILFATPVWGSIASALSFWIVSRRSSANSA